MYILIISNLCQLFSDIFFNNCFVTFDHSVYYFSIHQVFILVNGVNHMPNIICLRRSLINNFFNVITLSISFFDISRFLPRQYCQSHAIYYSDNFFKIYFLVLPPCILVFDKGISGFLP